MKKLILILFAFFPLLAFSQTDSTIINISSVSDGDLWAICQLTDIQLQKIICHDKTLNGSKDYLLKEANSCSDGKFKIPINKEFPVLTYTPPFDSGLQINSYCLLNEEDVSEWYEKFHLEHYYIIYLEIK